MMSEGKQSLDLDESESSLALHALRFYMNAKGYEVSNNTKALEAKLVGYLGGTTFIVQQDESAASILGARGGAKGGASTSQAKKAAAASNGAKGGRPHKPNLFIKFAKSVWQQPDPGLLNKLYLLIGNNTWLPNEQGEETEGPYVRVYVPEITPALEKMLKNSLNVFEWDDKPFLRLCTKHKNDSCREITKDERLTASSCNTCREPAQWIF